MCYTLGFLEPKASCAHVTEEAIHSIVNELGVLDDVNSFDLEQYIVWFESTFRDLCIERCT